MMVIVLTGGIGCGKSAVGRLLHDRGADVLDLDEVVRDLHTREPVRRAVSASIGVDLDYSREDVAHVVFRNSAKLRALEDVLHPLVWEAVDAYRGRHAGRDVVLEIPLPPNPQAGDRVICVEAPVDVRKQRLMARGMSEVDAQARISSAPAAAEYRKHAEFVLDNSGSPEQLIHLVDAVWKALHDDES